LKIKVELIEAQQLAHDENGRILVWSGGQEEQTPQGEPAHVAQRIPAAERRQLTVMFCDLVDSTRLSGQIDPEDYREVVRAYQNACAEVIQRFDGYIAQYLGDGLLVYFGYPQAHEDDAQRAVRAGLRIVGAMEALNTHLEQRYGMRVAVRLGIHTGLVVVGEVGSGNRQENLALGETPNVAARIQGLAAPDTVAISPATFRLVRGYFRCQDLGSHTLKGLAAPLQVYRVLGESEAQSRLEVVEASGFTPLVGRESEVALLLERWAQSQEGRGQVVLLRGEAGIGKSRLVEALRERVRREGATHIAFRCSPYYQNSALYPVIDHLQRFLQWQRDDTPEANNRARELCQQVGEAPQLFRVLYGLWHFHVVRAELQTARGLSEELLTLAQRIQDPTYLLGAHWTLGGALFCLGDFALAREHWAESMARYDSQQHHAHISLFGVDLGVFSLCWAPHALWHLGYPQQALAMSRKAFTLAQELSHPFTLAITLAYVAMLHQFRREPHAIHEQTEAAIALCAEQRFAYYLAWGTTMQGWARVAQGQKEDSLAQIRHGLAALRATGASLRLPYYLALLAEACGQTGQAAEGLTLLAEALTQAHKTEESWPEAELHRLKGELLLSLSADNHAEAEGCLHQALAVARRQQAKALELRAAMSLSRLWQRQGKRAEAHQLLAEVYGWFTEGFDTPDLQEAKALLEALA
jgi:class 3 adenylate cyclase/predicted ATPase